MTTQSSPIITEMKVIPVAGHDSMLLNIGGAHNAWFTRNIVVLTDNAGHTGVGEAPGVFVAAQQAPRGHRGRQDAPLARGAVRVPEEPTRDGRLGGLPRIERFALVGDILELA